MRLILPVALMFACATAVDAQEKPRVGGDAPASAVTSEPVGPRAPAPAPATVTAPDIQPEISPAAAAATETRSADDSSALVQSPPRNFWWLIIGIVAAGIILAVLL